MPSPDTRPPEPDEYSILQQRRLLAGLSSPEQLAAPVQALALSGGGIRSATFCLGLVRALAKNQVLRHFDYMSTVSGGGYLGSALSRLYGPDRKAQAVQEGVARDDSVWLWWLRSNGRYLTPAGVRDLGLAFASIFRGVLATHVEVGMLLLVAAGMLLLPNMLLSSWVGMGHGPAWLALPRDHGGSFWWWAMAVPIFTAFHHIFAYWFWRTGRSRWSTVVDLVVAVVGAVIAWRWGSDVLAEMGNGSPTLVDAASALACLLLVAPATGEISRWARVDSKVPEARLRHTKGLARALWLLLILGVLGALDFGSWWLSRHIESPTPAAVTAPVAGAIIAAVRLLITKIGDLKKWLKASSRFLDRARLLNVVGIALLALLVVVWVTGFQWFADAEHQPWHWLEGILNAHAWLPSLPTAQWLVLFIGPLVYVALTSANLELLNLSSLHNFYRARIERAYVSTGNANRFGEKILLPRKVVDTTTREMRLTESVDGDDLDLVKHKPHLHGGPIHLINCCINQTVDDRTDSYNADRKGVFLTVSALGAETGTRFYYPDGVKVPGTLSMWAAISGAAASSGMGSQTSPGSAALMFLSGLRLGYWQEAVNRREGEPRRWTNRPKLVRSEALARFPGLRSAQWYLSDGGHFDNTGVYSLLKRKVRLIVLADCGADPDYGFEDLENLVRKAEIDYACNIEFVSAPEHQPTDGLDTARRLRAAVGKPAEYKKCEGEQCLLLGRVRYDDGTYAALIVVKPRLVPGLPLDIVAYGQRNSHFPQQSTGDQFFDEAQWEGYHQLGLHLGGLLTAGNLQLLRFWAVRGV
jgi:hypothetical protein